MAEEPEKPKRKSQSERDREAMRRLGSKGGAKGKGPAKARSSEQARDAVNTRWDRVRKKKAEESDDPPV
jgi:hypothetical protein